MSHIAAPGDESGLAVRPRAERPALPLVGVVGGMGPLASTELLRTVYRACGAHREQESPRVLLWSDPAVVDRTEAIDRGDLEPLYLAVEKAVRGLVTAGAERVVVACVTAHRVLGDLPAGLLEHCVSLVDIVHEELSRTAEPHLLLCTKGTAQAGILVSGLRGEQAARRLVMLRPGDQEALHDEVYRVKRGADPLRTVDFLRGVLPRYGVRSFVAACTELHLVTQAIAAAGRSAEFPAIDPLSVVAQRIKNGEL
ncbi:MULTISPECIES: aspartate/glutamate racemase family protein [Streptomyces]|uniref:Aspartate/glutamate racemase family protein n=1 Tax=Streptomyces caniscabiei TaxID=2746961 RepID=A0ABU4N1A9_9ACTN|nr:MULTISPECIES: aspartate/glutamate racemase family protein [Streptomyces]MBE4741683.1 aspartate/glutamate racemase family protein [Streptomyces caniscabiei]MBE4762023.1 aspartate/glutamate racemase family protein [Streptomyces caniscabiei]MBE4775330.1 aspartate/glutamate racemase family protein [Streptomyces caniscabiei]MBE4790487.1 aspartate/glutamate racemase family protein [Streptomyces caniscabiei]MBE4799650.1 aspartate/glutamate racemase family protein [Streptomyces caniscabiei]